ncbi:MAG: transposase [Thermodesulfobacteriota bacterium]
MARLARVVVPGFPHLVAQQGNRRLPTFLQEDDFRRYIELMSEWCRRFDVSVRAYCLMTNHVHLILVPETHEGLARAVGEAHRRYTRYLNSRQGWSGYLWQGRFASFPLHEDYLLSAVKYVELNPVRAGLVSNPFDYPWSSARSHLEGQDDGLVQVQPLLESAGGWKEFLEGGLTPGEREVFQRHLRTGRPLGDGNFVSHLEELLSRFLKKKKPGPRLKR